MHINYLYSIVDFPSESEEIPDKSINLSCRSEPGPSDINNSNTETEFGNLVAKELSDIPDLEKRKILKRQIMALIYS
ncbi:hypothetical protein QE152_g34787 [Popillia japonica]|uniref:BESS domain-containing protein n=1 Tax=Popillia japonica TaxID=7064 RepID=A0AAW1ITE9_POPJA